MKPALVLRRSEVRELFSLDDCITAVEAAFREQGQGKLAPAGMMGMHVSGGGFHIKAAVIGGYFAAKLNGNFPQNRQRSGLPTIQGVIVLCDAANGSPLAVMDSIEITSLRTGAATAVAAKYLARSDSRVASICGCGVQGRVQLRAIARVLPIEEAYAFDCNPQAAETFAREMSGEARVRVTAIADVRSALQWSDVCVTCTTAERPFIMANDVRPGTFLAAVGADNPHKHELDVELFRKATVVVDSLEQCASIGDLHHAISQGVLTREQVHAELAGIVAGNQPGRTEEGEITIFDSTGIALEDVAAARLVYERALEAGVGYRIELAA